jgi:protein-S-isoprenylcysteine O-methyltransferase Ste14
MPLRTILLALVLSLGVALAVFTAFVPSSADRVYAFLRKPKVRLALSGCSALLGGLRLILRNYDSWNSSHMWNRGLGAALVIASALIFYAFWKDRGGEAR